MRSSALVTPPRQAAVSLKSEDSVSRVSLDFLPAAHSRHSGATARETEASESLAIALNRPKNICVRQPTRVTLSDASTRPGFVLLSTRSTATLNVPPRPASVNLPSRPVSNLEPNPSTHPFDAEGFLAGCRAAGYVEPLDVRDRKSVV
mgnify:FL=1